MKKFAVVGLGRVGKTLALYFTRWGFEFIGGYCSTAQSTEEALRELGIGKPLKRGELRKADLVFLCVPDREINREAERISRASGDLKGVHFLHCSGSRGREALEALKNKGAEVGVFHPLFPFFDLEFSLKNLEGSFVGIEGDYFPLAKRVGLKPFKLPENRVLYHAGAVFSAGLLASYLSFPLQIAGKISIPFEAYFKLAEIVLRAIKEKGLPQAITGPWIRGDEETVKSHLSVLKEREIYEVLLKRAKEILKKEG